MNILVLGADGRAHALVWKLFNSAGANDVLCYPGNGGSQQLARVADILGDDPAEIARWAFGTGVDVIVPADSRALGRGLVDEAVSLQVGVCGPSQRSTQIETSRCFAKEFMLRYGLPTPAGRAFSTLATAEKFLATHPLPVMIKADHSEGGEAVYTDRHAALAGLRELFDAPLLVGNQSRGVVIEAFVLGSRVVLSAFTDGRTAVPLLATRLYDRLEPGDKGPRASGMGAHTGNSRFAELLTQHLHQHVVLPVLAGLVQEGLPFWGILGVDCIITNSGPRLVAIRCSFREGEAQAVLPRLEDDLLPWINAMVAQRLHELPPPRWTPTSSVSIGLVARGYPYHFPTGGALTGTEDVDQGVLLFHSGTEQPSGTASYSLLGMMRGGTDAPAALRVAGGHVLSVVAQAPTLAQARDLALRNAERVRFDGRVFRDDIAAKEFA